MFKLSALLALVAIAALTADQTPFAWKPSDKAYYADANTINFVRPGTVLKINNATITSDGTMSLRISATDPRGLGLDRLGVTTPGPLTIACMVAVLPKNADRFVSYTTRVQTSPITGQSATQAATENNGTWTTHAEGDYTYIFRTKAPANFDATALHRAACQATRNLTEFELGTDRTDAWLNFVPSGQATTQAHDIVRTSACNDCHGKLAFHGGARQSMEYCVMCHTPQTTDPDTGNTVDMTVMTHKIHMGKNLPSVRAGTPYVIIGNAQSRNDYSHVGLPVDPGKCEVCHQPDSGAAQANNHLTNPSRAACGSCHDDVDFATGKNHVNLPQLSDTQCKNCHIPQGELPFDASIKGAHVSSRAANTPGLIPEREDFVPGMVFDNLQVKDGTAGSKPTITFTLKDKAGNPIALSSLRVTPNRAAAVLAGPTTDYGYTNFGSDVTTGGYVSEDMVAGGGTCDASGNCTYTFKHAIPADAKGTFSIGLEGRRELTILPGTEKELHTEYGALNKVINFSVDGSPVVARRTVVTTEKCNACHVYISFHGTNRNRIEQCVLCHNPSETDKAARASAPAAEKAKQPNAIDLGYMIHRIHTGEELVGQGANYTVIGRGGTVYDYTEVGYPVMTATGGVGNTARCDMCHVNGSEQRLPEGLHAVTNPQSPWNPMPRTTAVCTGCHATMPALSHAAANTTQFGESCSACHGPNAQFSVSRSHAQ